MSVGEIENQVQSIAERSKLIREEAADHLLKMEATLEQVIHFESRIERFDRKGGEYFMVVPDEVAAIFVTGRKPERIRCRIDGQVDFQCAIRPRAAAGFYINVATTIRQAGRLVLGQNVKVAIQKDDSTYGRDMPEELEELLSQDEEGNRLFHQILPSKQRGMIHYIASAKSVQVRVDRAVMMVNRLKNGQI